MKDKTVVLKQQTKDGLNLTYQDCDEALESAAIVNGAIKNDTLTFCSTLWTCPTGERTGIIGIAQTMPG